MASSFHPEKGKPATQRLLRGLATMIRVSACIIAATTDAGELGEVVALIVAEILDHVANNQKDY